MKLDLILNELSLQNHAPDEQIARQWMSGFIKTIKAVKAQGLKVDLRTKEDFHTTILAPNYPLRRWLNDHEVDQVERSFVKVLATKTPFSTEIKNLEIQEIENNVGSSEFWYQGEQAIGLGVAYMLDAIALSLLSEQCWDCSSLKIELRQLDENGEIIHDIVEIIHASCSKHVQEHGTWIKKRILTGVSDGVDLWNRREELFPNLEFCDAVSKQLQNIRAGQLELQTVVKALFELQNCCQTWNTGSFSVKEHPIEESVESEATLNKYSKERTFRCPDGKERLFERHVKLRLCNWRIHFFPEKPGKVIVGYVGRHLPTVKYRT